MTSEARPSPPSRNRSSSMGAVLPTWLLRASAWSLALLLNAAALWLVGGVVFAVPLLFYSLTAAVLAAALLQPTVGALSGRGMPRWAAVLLTELALLGFVLGVLVFMGRRVMAQALDLSGAVDTALSDLQAMLSGPPLSLSEQRVDAVRQQVVTYVEGLAVNLATGFTMVLEILSGVTIAVFVLFFLLKDGPRMWSWALEWRGLRERHRTDEVASEVWRTLTGYTRGVAAVALIDSVAIGAGLFVLDVPLWLALTLLVFVGAFIPFLGALVSGALAVAVTAVTVGTAQAVVVLVIVLLVQQFEGSVLQPLIVGRAVQLHPVVVLAVATAGWLLAGIGGAVLAVPVTAAAHRFADLTIGPRSHARAAALENDPGPAES